MTFIETNTSTAVSVLNSTIKQRDFNILNVIIYFSLSDVSTEELHAQDLVKRGEIDQALAIYEQLKPESARILRIIGGLCAEKKGDYDRAINYFEQALQIQQEVSK